MAFARPRAAEAGPGELRGLLPVFAYAELAATFIAFLSEGESFRSITDPQAGGVRGEEGKRGGRPLSRPFVGPRLRPRGGKRQEQPAPAPGADLVVNEPGFKFPASRSKLAPCRLKLPASRVKLLPSRLKLPASRLKLAG